MADKLKPRAGSASAPGAPAAPSAIRCDFTAPGAFGSADPRAGAYEPGQVLRVPRDISARKAQALLDGGGFSAVETKE